MSVRLIYGILVSFINPSWLSSLAIIIKPCALLRFHKALVDRKYHWLFTHKSKSKPRPKGPSAELIKIIVEMKRHNPRFGYLRIALQIKQAFGIVTLNQI